MTENLPPEVIVYGTVCLDAIWQVASLPEPDGFAPILQEENAIGGEACNTAIALHLWGVRVLLAGTATGQDERGAQLRALFASQLPHFSLQHVASLPGARTPFCACIATPDGMRTMYGTGFEQMQCPQLDRTILQSARFFTMDPNAWQISLQTGLQAAEAGCQVIAMDFTSSAEMNRAGRAILTSLAALRLPGGAAEARRQAAELRDRYERDALITCGEKGCYLAEAACPGEPALHIPASKAPRMVDATGAGDMFRAGLIYGLLQNWPIASAAEFASAAAALNCAMPGGWGGVRPVDEVLQYRKTAPLLAAG